MHRALILIALVLVGCAPSTATYHWKQGASMALLNDDLLTCKATAARDIPVDTRVEQTPIMQTPIQTICKPGGTPGETVCTTTGGEIYGGDVYSYDANAKLRGDYFGRCMRGKGYGVAEVPLCDSKQQPVDLAAVARKGSRPPVEGSCAVKLQNGGLLLVYPGEFG
jgi:hypothetical protein